VLGGLGAALCWALSTICGSRSSRIAGSAPALAWMALFGLLVAAPIFILTTTSVRLTGSTLGWLLLTGAGNMVGLFFEYQGFRYGPVGVVASIASTEGAIAATLSFIAGERPPAILIGVLPVLLVGLFLVTAPTNLKSERPTRWGMTIIYSVLCALTFGAGLYATGRVGGLLPAIWAVMPSRLLGVLFLTAPLGLLGRLRMPKAAFPWTMAGGLAEVGGFASFAMGSRHSIALAAVIASQFAVIATVAVALLFHERITRRQGVGVAFVAIGVAAVAAARAVG
jgi:drug/metabolite transporter (DMT)-like permease